MDQSQHLLGGALESQAQFNVANGWENFGSGDNQSFTNMEFDWNLDPALTDDPFTMNFIHQFQGQEQPAPQEQQLPIQEQQPATREQHQEQAGQQLSDQGNLLQQDNGFLGDANFAANMQLLADFNAQS